MQELEVAMRAKAGLIWLVTNEEYRVERSVAETCLKLRYGVCLWSVTEGLKDLDGNSMGSGNTTDPTEAIKFITRQDKRLALIMRDLGPFLTDALTIRTFKDLNRTLPPRLPDRAVQVIVLDTDNPPKSLPSIVLEWPMPNRLDIGNLLDTITQMAPESVQSALKENGTREEIIDSAIGLTSSQAAVAMAKSLVLKKTFDPVLIASEKRNAVRGSGLEWFDPDPRGLDAIGGLNNLKLWLLKRHAGLTKEGRDYGLLAPRGTLLLGVPGVGKSLTAKCVANAWNVPLLRLDVGALFSKWVGESERTIRQALSLTETIAPACLWLDEIEKSGFGSEGDAGTSQRVFATFLTWMQEKTAPVFVIGTANDVSKLPPEFLRAGRWDDVFFIDLPVESERVEIVGVLKKKYRQCDKIDPKKVAETADGYTGAEIEAAITAAMYTCFNKDGKAVDTKAVIAELKQIVPISKSMSEKIGALRSWAERRARPATVIARSKNKSPVIEME
jgi:hypothetical protein